MKRLISNILIFAILILLGSGMDNFSHALTFQKIISGAKGDGSGEFNILLDETGKYIGPNQINIDDKGNIYVSDGLQSNNRIVEYNKAGELIQLIGGKDIFPHDADNPRDITFTTDNRYLVLETRQSMVYVFSSNGEFLSKHHTMAIDAVKILVDKFNQLYVEDIRNDNIKVLDKDLNYVATLGGEVSEIGRISSFALTEGGHLVVAPYGDDWHLKSYLINKDQLTLIKEVFLNNIYGDRAFGSRLVRADDYGHIYVKFFVRGQLGMIIQRFNASGNVVEEYLLPEDSRPIEVDSKGNIYFGQCDENEFRVMKVVK